MDTASLTVRLGIPSAPRARPADLRDVVAVARWLPRADPDGHPLRWTAADARRLAFARWLYLAGVLTP